MKEYLKFLPLVVLTASIIGSAYVTSNSVDRLTVQMVDVQVYISDTQKADAALHAEQNLKIKVLEKEHD